MTFSAGSPALFPRVAYDVETDVLYIALAGVRNCYARPDESIPNMLHCFNELDDEPCGILVRGFSTLDRGLLSQRIGLDLDWPAA